jgi:hypothetical protein
MRTNHIVASNDYRQSGGDPRQVYRCDIRCCLVTAVSQAGADFECLYEPATTLSSSRVITVEHFLVLRDIETIILLIYSKWETHQRPQGTPF